MIKAIPTKYGGIRFKSKLEANWAEWLDSYDIIWAYEPEGYDIKGLFYKPKIFYLPDFYLPELNTIIEVKGAMQGLEKPYAMMKAIFEKEYNPDTEIMFLLAGPVPCFYNISPWYYHGFYLHKCPACNKISIVTVLGVWRCRVCGEHRGKKGNIYDRIKTLTKPLQWLMLEGIEEKEDDIFGYKI